MIRMLFCVIVVIGGVASADEYELKTGQRLVPLPAAASEQLRESIRNWPAPDVSASSRAPASEAEWRAIIGEDDRGRKTRIQNLIAEGSVDVQQSEIAGVTVFQVIPENIAPENERRLFIFLHGGAYVFGGGIGGVAEAMLIAERLGIEVISVDYRMPPGDPFPAALDDTVAVYRELVSVQAPGSIALGGTSAGGGLSLAVAHKLKSLGLPLPGAIYAGTPWSDLTKTGDTQFTNEGLDRIIVTYDGILGGAASLYADGRDLKDPLLSPIYGDLSGFPPTILTTGTRDMFLSDVARTHRKLRAAGVSADLHVYEGMSHAGYLFAPNSPESLNMYEEVSAFMNRHLE